MVGERGLRAHLCVNSTVSRLASPLFLLERFFSSRSSDSFYECQSFWTYVFLKRRQIGAPKNKHQQVG
ncbi:hypothetical protein JTE90_005261 [Oedothorax gibbosus]|uniref:Uncharacterized protein n=1 Tax=Oedothorax gibbosus TaxID=931172 RepID=A0AAV6U5D6_9ARAC|nr:hypothetical protein JTE90_005261 [Oedothorax gibbosus]